MFERYNGHARRAVFFARFAASQSGSAAIESEHLLLGLIREAGSMFSRLTPSLSLEDLRAKIPRKIVVENPEMRIHMPISAESKRILSYSAEEANDLEHRYIGPEHLLLAILRENTCLGARVLTEMDVQLEVLRQKLALESAQGSDAKPGEETTVEVGRDIVHALVDKLPEQMLTHVKEMIDRMLSRSRRENGPDEATVVKGPFSTNRPESTEKTPER